MGQVRDLIGAQRAAAAGMVGPAEDSRFEEGAIDDQLRAAFEEVDQADPAPGAVELVPRLNGHPGHAPAFGGQCVARTGEGFLLDEQVVARSLPLLRRDDWGGLDREMLHFCHLAHCHLMSPLIWGRNL